MSLDTTFPQEPNAEAKSECEQAAVDAADSAASIVSTGALLAFVALVLGAISGWLGGRSGAMNPVYAERIIPSRRHA